MKFSTRGSNEKKIDNGPKASWAKSKGQTSRSQTRFDDGTFYQNENVIRFIESKGVKIRFHSHKYSALKKDYVILYCEGCGDKWDVPGLSMDEAQAYIDHFFVNTGYAYIA